MLDCFWLPDFVEDIPPFQGVGLALQQTAFTEELRPETRQNIRLVALNDAQLSCILSCLIYAEYKNNWVMHYVRLGNILKIVPDSPLGNTDVPGRSVTAVRLSALSKEFQDFQKQRIDVFTSELKEQLMIDLTPYFESLVLANETQAAQLESIAADIAALRLEAEAESYADSLETLAEYAPLLLAVL